MSYYNYYPQYPFSYYNQSYTQNNNVKTMEWVDGEVGAKAFQMPPGWPVNSPIALWDSTEKKVFLKSWNAMGMANPMQELDYVIREQPVQLPENTSGQPDMNKYVTKEEFDKLRQEIRNLANNKNRGAQQ